MALQGEDQKPVYHDVDGTMYHKSFKAENVRSAVAFEAKAGQVFIATYPKCGTTWMQHIVYLIYSKGNPAESFMEFELRAPFLEFSGAGAAEAMRESGAIKVHQPFGTTPYHPDAKYIYVARNPFDACVSFYNHHKIFPEYLFTEGKFDTFFEIYLEGKRCEFGDYFDNLLSWWPHRSDPNVLFLVYEDMRGDPRDAVLKVAKFLGDNYCNDLLSDPTYLDNVLRFSDINYMKQKVNAIMLDMMVEARKFQAQGNTSSGDAQKDALLENWVSTTDAPKTMEFIRSGAVKEWRKFFSEDQEKRLKEKFISRTQGTGIDNLWGDLFD